MDTAESEHLQGGEEEEEEEEYGEANEGYEEEEEEEDVEYARVSKFNPKTPRTHPKLELIFGEPEDMEELDKYEFPNSDEDEGEEKEDGEEENMVPVSTEELPDDTPTDSFYDVAEGYADPSNFKLPLIGFSEDDQNKIFPLVDVQSSVLFEIVQELEDAQLKSSEKVLLGIGKPVAIPSRKLAISDGGPEIKLRILEPASLEEKKGAAIVKTPPVTTNVTDVPEKILAALPTDLFAPDKKALLMRTLELGMKANREKIISI
jgi:hypothetical protein